MDEFVDGRKQGNVISSSYTNIQGTKTITIKTIYKWGMYKSLSCLSGKEISRFIRMVVRPIISLIVYVSQKTKTPKNHHFDLPHNHSQIQDTTIPLYMQTKNTIPDLPIYFLSTLTISTIHTRNVLLIRLFDKFVILTKQRCGDYFSTLS